jgi:hypothetical protein
METPTQKPKVDLKEIMNRAKNKTSEVKASTENIAAKTNPFRILPGFSKYEFNGNILRNVQTKHPLSPKTGRTKYQITDDSGKSHNLNKEEIQALFPEKAPMPPKNRKVSAKEPKTPKPAKISPAAKKEKPQQVAVVLPEDLSDLSKKEILALPGPNHRKIYLLHASGKSNEEIKEIIGSPIPTIARDIWRYKTGKVKMEK